MAEVAELKGHIAGKAPVRAVYVYKVPQSVPGSDEIRSIGIRKLTPREELIAHELGRGKNQAVANELARLSLSEINGKPLTDDEDKKEQWSKFDPKLRTLLVTAYTHLHVPEDDEVDSFMKSEEVRVS